MADYCNADPPLSPCLNPCEPGSDICGYHQQQQAKLEADARALWSIRVLDRSGAWRMRGNSDYESAKLHVCVATDGAHYGSTPDAARYQAALSVYPSLPADVRERLGEL